MKDEIIRETKKILLEMNVNASWKGFRYLATAVYLKIQDEEIATMKLYEKVAKKHRTTASKVERACRYMTIEIFQKHLMLIIKLPILS